MAGWGTYQRRFNGLGNRVVDPEVQQMQKAGMVQNYQMNQLRLQQMQFQNSVLMPLQARKAELDMQKQQSEAVTYGMEQEVEQARLQNRLKSQQQATGLHQTFLKMHPVDRYKNRSKFADHARTIYEVNPNEHTEALFKNFARWEIEREISGEPPALPASPTSEQTESYDKGITFDGKKQIKVDGKFVDATPQNIAKAESQRPVSKEEFDKAPVVSKNPGMPGAYRDGAEVPGTSTETMVSTEPTSVLPEKQEAPKYRDRIQQLQDLRQKYSQYEDLIQPIEYAIQKEMNRPQYWAKQFDHFSSLPEETQSIVNKAKTGQVITPLERKIAESSVDKILSGDTNRRYTPPAPFSAIENFSKYTPEVQQSLINQYGREVFAPQIEQQQTVPTPVMASAPTSETTSIPTEPVSLEKGKILEEPVVQRTADPERTAKILESFRNNPELNTSFGEYLKSGAWASLISYPGIKKIEKEAHNETSAKIAVERQISDEAQAARDLFIEKRNPADWQKWTMLKEELKKVRGLSNESVKPNSSEPASNSLTSQFFD